MLVRSQNGSTAFFSGHLCPPQRPPWQITTDPMTLRLPPGRRKREVRQQFRSWPAETVSEALMIHTLTTIGRRKLNSDNKSEHPYGTLAGGSPAPYSRTQIGRASCRERG